MYVMLTGRPLFRGDNINEILEKKQTTFNELRLEKYKINSNDIKLIRTFNHMLMQSI